MARFWLGTFSIGAVAADVEPLPILERAKGLLAIEVLRDGDEWAVLFSKIDNLDKPMNLECLIGFTNAAKACNVWHSRGFPIIDATIREDGPGELSIISPSFLDELTMKYEASVIALAGIAFGGPQPSSQADHSLDFITRYEQDLQSPDSAQPDVLLKRQPVAWTPRRSGVSVVEPPEVTKVRINIPNPPSTSPSLAPLKATLRASRAWTGDVELPTDQTPQETRREQTTLRAADVFGVPAFRFEDVEILGFRIDLGKLDGDFDSALEELVAPLNFHLTPATGRGGNHVRNAIPDFRYRAATRTLVIELLRYGRMKSRAPVPPLTVDHAQSQHELTVRLLVGRVDDDSAQARAPAVFVPAIFVDNPWSKLLGRDMLGFDKRMAEFCVGTPPNQQRLLPDGRLPTPPRTSRRTTKPVLDDAIEPLGAISEIRLVDTTGVRSGAPLLDLEFDSSNHTDPDVLERIDLDFTFGASPLAGTRWRQTDFDDAEFRRSFATLAVAESVRAFRGIQVAPVSSRNRGLPQTWITGTFRLDEDVRAAIPFGVATLRLHAVKPDHTRRGAPAAPAAWNQICEMLGGSGAKITLSTGSWYRLRCSMELTIDDGLDWSNPDV